MAISNNNTGTSSKLVEIDGRVYQVTVCPPGAANGSDYFQTQRLWRRANALGQAWAPDLTWYDRNLF